MSGMLTLAYQYIKYPQGKINVGRKSEALGMEEDSYDCHALIEMCRAMTSLNSRTMYWRRYDIKIMRFFRNTTIHRLIEDTHATPDKRNANLKEFNKSTAVGIPNKTGHSSEAFTKGIKELVDEWKQLEMSLNEIHSSHQHILEEVEDVLRLNSAPNSVPEALGDVLCSGNSPSCPTLLAYNPVIQSYCSPDNSPIEAICVPISEGGKKLSDKMGTIEFEIDLRSTKVLQTDSTTKPKEALEQELAELSAPMDNNCPSVDSYSKDLQDSPVTLSPSLMPLSPSLMPANLVQEALADFRLLSSEEQKNVVDRLEGTRLQFINIMKAPDGLNLDKEVSCSNANRSPSSSNPPAVSPDTVFKLPTKAIVHHMSNARSDTILSPPSANLVNLKNGCIQQNVTDIVSLGDGN
uniref:Uncharacterized protein n=1 Tax=Sphaerodactylus townsendi TaxID=933632 RepID=A0ACB8F5K8_9SAUR